MPDLRALRSRLLMATLSLGILAASASAQIYKPLFRFDSASVGLYPEGGLILDAAGNLYGTAHSGGTCSVSSSGCGLVFELSPSASGWTETVLYTFSGPDGISPSAGVVFDTNGNLYGTTSIGGAYNNGTVFELSPTASGWQEQVLYSFTGGSDGGALLYGVVLDVAGNVYGTAYLGGANNQGVLFQLTNSGSGWTENVLLNFDNLAGTGPSPLAFDAAGNLYGTATTGNHDFNHQRGTIYELLPNGVGGWTENTFFTFTGFGTTGTAPAGGVVFDNAGNLYGTTTGESHLVGLPDVFELSTPTWNETNLKQLAYENFGIKNSFSGPLTVDASGNVYGAVYNNSTGAYQTYDGFVFRVGPSGSATFTFPIQQPAKRFYPLGGLAIDAQGTVYGETSPAQGVGSVFEVIF